ncbi:GPP34 family phosphoprotein [Amycolatopsis antarctica]|uniref:GPP34 family phosphoprotein n=1 Tax=Amycolatopsis antarctica TaxID=1854586 RepID=A0A263DA62_9PSEU|nr:GPP34 family phosphoprotein [Amycolatopsis antarctica]OZM74376.1 GPP34 family phosphoprotein [Amycolatopsis antarctica]
MNETGGTSSLPAQAYLLACDIGARRVPDRQQAGHLVRAAALTDLLLRGRLVDDDGRAVPRPGGSTGDDLLDEVLGEIVEAKPGKWKSLVRQDPRGTLRSLEALLDSARVIRLEQTTTLGIFRRRKVTVRDEGGRARLAAIVDGALRGGGSVERLPREDAALTALVAAVELRGVVSRADRRRNRDRLDALEEHAGVAVPALRKVFREVRNARIAAASAGSHGS